MKRQDCTNPFLRGYLDAALFTTNPDPGSGDFIANGQAGDLFPRIPASFIEQAERDCASFQAANAELLEHAGDDEQNGMDFWYTRNGHGVGFWDRGYEDEVGDTLTAACKRYGEHYLELGGWWEQSYTCQCGEEWTRPEDADNDPDFGTDTCEACGAEVESDNRKYGENLTAIDEPED